MISIVALREIFFFGLENQSARFGVSILFLLRIVHLLLGGYTDDHDCGSKFLESLTCQSYPGDPP